MIDGGQCSNRWRDGGQCTIDGGQCTIDGGQCSDRWRSV